MAGLAPEQVTRLLRDRATKLRLDLGGVEAGLKVTQEMGLPQIFVVEEEFRRAMLTTELDYVTHLAEAIRSDELTGVTGWRTLQRLLAQGLTFEEIMRDPVRHLGEEAAVFADLDEDT